MDPTFKHNTTATSDGGTLSYYTIGAGPSLLVIHGSASFALTHKELGVCLKDHYTVHIASRRGRGLSSGYPNAVVNIEPLCDPTSTEPLRLGNAPYQRAYSKSFTNAVLATEIGDLNSLITSTGAEIIIAVSSGAVIVLHALLQQTPGSPITEARKIILFEPPILFTDIDMPFDHSGVSRMEKEAAKGDTVGVMVTAMRTAQLGPGWIPRWAMRGLTSLMIRYQESDAEKRRVAGEEDQGVSTMRGFGGLMRYDFAVVEGTIGESRRFQALNNSKPEILLLHGSNSPEYLQKGVLTLGNVIASAKRAVLDGVGHEVLCNADMRGQPSKAVPAIRDFCQ